MKSILIKVFGVLLVIFFVVCMTGFLRKKVGATYQTNLANLNSGREVCVQNGESYKIIDCEEYLLYALAGFVDMRWDDEMLKVAAVLMRTSIYRQMNDSADTANGGGKIINEGDLSEIRYEDRELRDKWQSSYDKNIKRLYQAVYSTMSQVIVYHESIILPVFHNVSIGTTVSALELYGADIPYLIQVDSSQDVNAENFSTSKVLSEIRLKKEFQNVTENKNISSEADKPDDGIVAVTDATPLGFAQNVNVFGRNISGEDFAKTLELGSTNFHIDKVDEGYRIITIGNGSCVGISLYGANYLACGGMNYIDIICTYYIGCSVEKHE